MQDTPAGIMQRLKQGTTENGFYINKGTVPAVPLSIHQYEIYQKNGIKFIIISLFNYQAY
jgi:hypothetical protein